MKFNKLRLVGFKSFVEPSEFIIEPGLTGVVGPNGCGKSNLVEAMRWVMGENSYKNMRASGMDDVIFSGSGHRPGRNSAEVGLYLDNSDRTAPAAFNDSDEIQVTRRIERQNGSVYRINGKEARARDVQLLFADASTGARSPSMVGQGRIGELISAKPQARRQLLEEAAGISGLHSRRHEAELRLRGAEGNLERLEDVTTALDSQIESLKRQARQANRFKLLSAEIRACEAMLAHIRWVEAKGSEDEADSALNGATMVVAERAQGQMQAAKDQAIAGLQLPDLRHAQAQSAGALQRLQIARDQLDEEAARTLTRRDELNRRLLQLTQDMSRESGLITDNIAILARLSNEESELQEGLLESAALLDEAKESLQGATKDLAASEAELARLTAEQAQSAAGRAQLEKLVGDIFVRRQRLDRQFDDANRQSDAIEAQIAQLAHPDSKRLDVEAAEISLEDCENAILESEERLVLARDHQMLARQKLDEARTKLNGLETEAKTIARILSDGGPSDGFSPVSDQLSVERGFETALGAVLGDDLESALDPQAPTFWAMPPSAPIEDLPKGCQPLSGHIRVPAQLTRRLSQIGIVASIDGDATMAALKPGQSLVSMDGAVWRWDGHVTRAGVPGNAARRLAQKNRLGDLEIEIVISKNLVDAAMLGHQSTSDHIAEITRQLAVLKDEVRIRARQLSEARGELALAERQAAEALKAQAVATELKSGLCDQISEVEIAHEEAQTSLDAMEDISRLDEFLARQSTTVALDRAKVMERRALVDGQMREIDNCHRRLHAIHSERALWQDRVHSATKQLEALKARQSEASDELEELIVAPDAFDEKRHALVTDITKAEKLRRDAAERLVAAEMLQREADKSATTALSLLAEAREKRGRFEERLMSARQWRIDAETRIRDTMGVAPHEVLRLSGHNPDADLPEPRSLELNVERLKMERERLGAVNLRAEEEHRELSVKLDQLVNEREDIIEAIRKLRAAIQGLNREGRERLLAAFDAVNIHFKRLFTHLFNGGEAELQLIESDDPLEAGLEILARPPGKKPQTMTLLSGGEQALTAMALIFAVFLTNPAPICVLDEVDAPLDDHNVERYCNLMDEMASLTQTRFVIITHNPITMARMDRLFGVTMSEQGVSELVSVDLQRAEALREAV